jgi:hypothetical protein
MELIYQRFRLKPRLKVCQIPRQERYNKLKTESKLLMNVIKLLNQTETTFPRTNLKIIFKITTK